MSAFDPAAFLDMGTSEAGSTEMTPIPAGEYTAVINEVKARSVKTKNGEGVVVDVEMLLQAPDVAKQIGREKLSVRYSFFPELTANGGFDMSQGKNVKLNRLRDACGLNVPGQPFKISMLQGKMVKAVVSLRPAKDSDAIYNDVTAVGKL